jgi:hypothetical protein
MCVESCHISLPFGLFKQFKSFQPFHLTSHHICCAQFQWFQTFQAFQSFNRYSISQPVPNRSKGSKRSTTFKSFKSLKAMEFLSHRLFVM